MCKNKNSSSTTGARKTRGTFLIVSILVAVVIIVSLDALQAPSTYSGSRSCTISH